MGARRAAGAVEHHPVVAAGAAETGRLDARDLGDRPVGQVDVEDRVARQAVVDDLGDEGAHQRAGLVQPARLSGLHGEGEAGRPRRAASRAAPTVPEYVTSAPRFAPRLMPETTRSGRRVLDAEQADAHAVGRRAVAGDALPAVAERRRAQVQGAVDGDAARHRAAVAVGAMVVTSPRPSRAARSSAMPAESMPSSFVRRICRVTASLYRRAGGHPPAGPSPAWQRPAPGSAGEA